VFIAARDEVLDHCLCDWRGREVLAKPSAYSDIRQLLKQIGADAVIGGIEQPRERGTSGVERDLRKPDVKPRGKPAIHRVKMGLDPCSIELCQLVEGFIRPKVVGRPKRRMNAEELLSTGAGIQATCHRKISNGLPGQKGHKA
jgi:hypothetical protein